MRYQSNLTMPELTGFRLLDPPVQMMGHDIPSDPDFEPGCGFWSHDEAAILFNVADSHPTTMHWLDIGARFGWTGAALIEAGCPVTLVDRGLQFAVRTARLEANLKDRWDGVIKVSSKLSSDFLSYALDHQRRYSGFVIDADHDPPQPLNDAVGCLKIAHPNCIMMFHDGRGLPIRDAVAFLLDNGFRARFYYTPNGVFCCWRGFEGWEPPVHVRDPDVDWHGVEIELSDRFDIERLS